MKSTSLAVLLVFLLAAAAAAAPIDFRNAPFSGPTGADGHSRSPPPVLFSAAGPSGARLYQDSTDGLGVRYGYETDEIEGRDRLRISFTTPTYISSVLLTDFFNEGYLERGSYRLNGTGSWIGFSADPSQTPGSTNGILNLLLDPSILVNSIMFRAPGYLPFLNQRHEFSVAAIEVNAVPIPAAAWLLGSGMVGLVALRRRKSDSRRKWLALLVDLTGFK